MVVENALISIRRFGTLCIKEGMNESFDCTAAVFSAWCAIEDEDKINGSIRVGFTPVADNKYGHNLLMKFTCLHASR